MKLWQWMVPALLFAALLTLLVPMTVQLPLAGSHGCGPALEWNILGTRHGVGSTYCQQAAKSHLISAAWLAGVAILTGIIGGAILEVAAGMRRR
jgi:hypothetical protein